MKHPWTSIVLALLVPVSSQSATNITPVNLMPTVGPLIARQSPQQAPFSTYDNLYIKSAPLRYADYLANEATTITIQNHYGALRGRLMWALRNGEPIGAGVTNENLYDYARGRRMLMHYLQAYSAPNLYATPPHNNTGMPDIEALYVLEGVPEALNHLQCQAGAATSVGLDSYYKFQNSNADAREISVGLQSLSAGNRLHLPYALAACTNPNARPSTRYTTFVQRGREIILWLDQFQVVQRNGAILSPAHQGNEAYLFNAMLATELLKWSAFVEPTPRAEQLAVLIVDHLVSQAAALPGGVLGYQSNSAGPSGDLAAMFVWPALAIWQDTGNQKYFSFALTHLAASADPNLGYVGGIKQWNQTFSTGAQGAEALIAGVSWRTGGAVPPPPPTAQPISVSPLNSVRVYPNPWRADRHATHSVTFDRMGSDSNIKIFTTAGHLVREFDAPAGSGIWDLKNVSGSEVASGIYLYLIKDSGGQIRSGQLAVIR